MARGESVAPAASGGGATVAVPFLKWAGGKRQVLPEIRRRTPDRFGRYFEPFLGGGAVFFDLHADGRIAGRARLSDANGELVSAYRGVRSFVDDVVRSLRDHARLHSKVHYLEVRGQWALSDAAAAARLIYLNKTCFNGLYRVNKSGGFNVPMGDYANPTICDENNLRACSAALETAAIGGGDFGANVADATSGDFAYFDPPYVPVSSTSDFTQFTPGGFGMEEQRRLAALARVLKQRGVRVLLSNADLPVVRELYAGFGVERVEVRRNINSKGSGRGRVGELLIW